MTDDRIDANSLEVLRFLLRTENSSDRTLGKIRDACHLTTPGVCTEIMTRLRDSNLVKKIGDHFDLTTSGMAKVRMYDATRPGTTNVIINGSVTGSELRVQTGPTPAAGTQTGVLPPAPARPAERHHTPPGGLMSPGASGGTAGPQRDNETLDQSRPKHPVYTLHETRQTDTSFAQNEFLRANPDTRVHFVLTFEDTPAALPLPIVDNDRLGRERCNDLWLRHDVAISREHCRFQVKQRTKNSVELYVHDLSSRNGTWVNGERLKTGGKMRLEHGDRLKVGETCMVVSQLAVPAAVNSRSLRHVQQERAVPVSVPALPPASASGMSSSTATRPTMPAVSTKPRP